MEGRPNSKERFVTWSVRALGVSAIAVAAVFLFAEPGSLPGRNVRNNLLYQGLAGAFGEPLARLILLAFCVVFVGVALFPVRRANSDSRQGPSAPGQR